jgi:hypothetical protein
MAHTRYFNSVVEEHVRACLGRHGGVPEFASPIHDRGLGGTPQSMRSKFANHLVFVSRGLGVRSGRKADRLRMEGNV